MTNTTLLDQLRAEAARDVAQRLETARTEATRVVATAEAAATHARLHALEQQERAGETARAAALAGAQLEHLGAVLTARAEALERVFVAATRDVESLSASDRLTPLLIRQLQLALPFLPEGAVVVRCAPHIANAARAAVAATARDALTVEPTPGTPLGLVVATADGSMAVDVTFARQLVRQRGVLAIELARRIEEHAS